MKLSEMAAMFPAMAQHVQEIDDKVKALVNASKDVELPAEVEAAVNDLAAHIDTAAADAGVTAPVTPPPVEPPAPPTP